MFANLSYLDPQIEVLGESPRRDMLMSRLAAAGFRPIRTESSPRQSSGLPLIIDCASVDGGIVDSFVEFAEQEPDRLLVLLGPVARQAPPSKQIVVLRQDAELQGLRARLDLRQRQALCDSERGLRAETEAELLGSHTAVSPSPASRLLFFGTPSPDFLPLQRALKARQIDIHAAYTLPTAVSHMRSGEFSACLVDLANVPDVTLSTFSREDWTGSIIAMADPTQAVDSSVLDFLLDASLEADQLARDISGLLDRPALNSRIDRPKLSDTMHDLATGLYSADFLRAHLPKQIKADEAAGRPLSLLCLRARHADRPEEARTIDAIAPILAGRLRESDVACRYEAGAVLISLRAAAYGQATSIAARLVESIQNQAPELAEHLHWRVVERREYHSADMLIQSSVSGPFGRSVAA